MKLIVDNIVKACGIRMLVMIAALLLLVSSAEGATDYTPAMMPNVQVEDASQYVSDPGGLLSSSVKAEVNGKLSALRQTTTCEAVVAIPPSIGEETAAEWSEQLFSLWKIGKKDKDNGVLMMISPGSRCTFIMTGYGMEGVLTDAACSNIVHRAIIPAMREDDLDKAVLDGVTLICQAVEDPAVAEELRSAQPDSVGETLDTLDPAVIWRLLNWVAWLAMLIGIVFFIMELARVRKLDRYHKALRWRQSLPVYVIVSVFSLGAGLILLIIAWLIYRNNRLHTRRCSNCGGKMHRLSEEEDNARLSTSQDLEERLKTVDYDVWECPNCHHSETLAYKERQHRYQECPNCGTVAMGLVRDTVEKAPTTRSEGIGTREYECLFCHHIKRDRYKIPKKEDAAALAAAAGMAAAASRRRGGGGGFGGGGFGGGFGGGATGGGGAGGSW